MDKSDITFKERIKHIKAMAFVEALGINSRTWAKRVDAPENLTIHETAKIADMLNIKPTELMMAILKEANHKG